mmetsp:Transcript_7733/g.21536  ORF Transcript_7733/g.21536 Transcript_7733/m.21536 type:complete len:218 (+) Transcript_7733:72-725(+)
MMRQSIFAFLLILSVCHGFSPRPAMEASRLTVRQNRMAVLAMRRRNRSHDDDVASQRQGGSLPLLPPCSMKSPLWTPPSNGWTGDDNKTSKDRLQDPKQNDPVPFATNRKFELQYTCKVCETRNFNRVSRAAYRKGVVISQCKGCGSQHLIADHLGFTNLWNKDEHGGNIEEFFSQYHGMDDVVSRVSTEVFDLERTLNHDTSGGSILGEDGERWLD